MKTFFLSQSTKVNVATYLLRQKCPLFLFPIHPFFRSLRSSGSTGVTYICHSRVSPFNRHPFLHIDGFQLDLCSSFWDFLWDNKDCPGLASHIRTLHFWIKPVDEVFKVDEGGQGGSSPALFISNVSWQFACYQEDHGCVPIASQIDWKRAILCSCCHRSGRNAVIIHRKLMLTRYTALARRPSIARRQYKENSICVWAHHLHYTQWVIHSLPLPIFGWWSQCSTYWTQ